MFACKRFLIAILTLLVGFLAFFIAGEITGNFGFVFWFNLSAIWFAILFIGLSTMAMMKTDEKAMPMQFFPLIISLVYLGYTLIIPLFCFGVVLIGTLVIAHSIGLLTAVILIVISGMAHQNTIEIQNSVKQSFAARTSFRNSLSFFKMKYDQKLKENSDLNRKYMKLEDAIKYASDSVPGSEEADEKIKTAFQTLIDSDDAEKINKSLDELLLLIQWRQDVIKNLR